LKITARAIRKFYKTERREAKKEITRLNHVIEKADHILEALRGGRGKAKAKK
jgi:hypothetical protein